MVGNWLWATVIAAIAVLHMRPIHSEGRVVAKGCQISQSSAEQRQRAGAGDPEAQYQLSVQYSSGESPQDNEALKWFRKAADQGHPQAQATVGEFYLRRLRGLDRDPRQALAWFQKAADQGDAFGQSELGFMYEAGEGVPQDYAEAVRWYERAADQGLPIAQFDLAYLYENGKGTTADPEKAVRLYELAALMVPTARRNLAVLYANGSGPVRKDPVIAYKWAVLAISAEVHRIFHEREVDPEPRLGHAILLAEDIGKSMSKSQKKSARQLAQSWIDSNASHLGEEPRNFASATESLK